MTERVREILSWYGSDNPGTLTNLARLLAAGRLAGTGRLLILPVDQGFEHGPARSFAPNPPAYEPRYHFRLAIESGCSALAAPLGLLEAGARDHAGQLPLILKLNGHDPFGDERDPTQALTASVTDALRLGCVGVGYTIYPGSGARFEMYQALREVVRDAKANGLFVVVWAYPRGGVLAAEDESAVDVVAYAAHVAVELGAHIVKVKIPSARVAQTAAQPVYERFAVPIGDAAERIRHVVQAAFAGRRLVVFSGGATKVDDEQVLANVRAIRAGGGFGSMMGRNTFQRGEAEAKTLLSAAATILAG